MSKIFRIGFHKTGTKSLGATLENSDYRVCGSVGAKDPDIAKNVLPLIHSLGPYATPFRTIHSHFLTNTLTVAIPTPVHFHHTFTRGWVESVVHFGDHDIPMRRYIHGVGHPKGNEQVFLVEISPPQ